MKKILLIFALMIGAAAAVAQTPDTLLNSLKTVSEKCPVTISDGLVLKNVSVVDGNVQFDYTLDDGIFDNLSSIKDILHDAMLAELVSSPDQLNKTVVETCRANKLNILQRYTSNSGKVIDILITSDELK